MTTPIDTIQNIVKHANPLSLLTPRRNVKIGGVPGLTPQQIAEELKGKLAKCK